MASDRPLDAAAIRDLLAEVADELERSDEVAQSRVVVVGGSLLALLGLREATRDVNSAWPVDPHLADAVARVGARHGLAPRWLNDRARSFLPETFDLAQCMVVLDRPSLVVSTAPLEQVFLMKIHAGRAADATDLEALWPHCSFGSPERTAEAYRAAYPHERPDPHLPTWIAEVTGTPG